MEWMKDAACAGTNVNDWFYDEDTDTMNDWQARQRMLARVCSSCQVWDICRVWSLGDEHGIFGGSSRNIRIAVRADMGMIGPDNARHRGSKAIDLLEDGYDLPRAMKESGIPDHPYFHDYEGYEYRFR